VSSVTFWHLPSNLITAEVLWSQPVLQVVKQVIVTWSEIRAVRRMVKQLPDEMLQQCSSASSCMTPDVSIPCLLFSMALHIFLVFRNILLMLLWFLVAWIPPSAGNVTFLACLVNVCAFTALTALWFQHSQVSTPVARTMWFRNSSPSLWYRYKKSKPVPILCVLCTPVSIFRTHLVQNLW
jgi:hypothetical protein